MMEEKSEYLFVSSKDSLHLFPENKGGNFRVLIPPHFSSEWEIGITQLHIKIDTLGLGKHVLICCDQISKSSCSNTELGILRSVYLNKQIVQLEF